MRGCVALFLFASVAVADDRHVERTPAPVVPYKHTTANAGTDKQAKHWQPSVTCRTSLGYVNQATFGSDYSLFGRWPSRIFPGLWPDGRKPVSFSKQYATDGPIHVPDVLAAQPFRRAVIEAKAEKKGNGHE